jgi:NADPH:quinone reductase-like Zn-dependent oxidoreductase
MELREVDTPTPESGQVLVRVHAASVNAYDWHLIAADPFLVRIGGMGLRKPKYPRTGADFAGVVESLGGVNGYQRLKDYRRALTPNGTYVFAGGTNKQIFQGMLRVPLMNMRSSESLLAVGEKPNAADLRLVAGLVESGTVRSVIDRSYPFEEAPQAVAYVQEGHAAGKVIVEVRPE